MSAKGFKDKKQSKNDVRKGVGRERGRLRQEAGKGQAERSTQAELKICKREKVTAIMNPPAGKTLP